MADITKKVVVRFPPEIHAALKIAAVGDDPPSSFNSLVLYACRRFLATIDGPNKTSNEGPPVEAHPIEDVRAPVTSRPVARTDRGPSSEKRATRAKERGTESPRATAPIPAGRREVVTHFKGGKP